MPTYKVASLQDQGQDMLIVPVDSSFTKGRPADIEARIAELQTAAVTAGLKGLIALVWADGERMAYLAPQPWHAFFHTLSMPIVEARLNAEISW
ncbi:MAG: hypothetical protein P4M15_04390 [Alphaproteobacteria bacterium]|nr:hypothetical protein [Alphaproteobacteria bacterium]